MGKKTADISRILNHQKQMCQLSQWLLVKLDTQAQELSEREQRILEALSKGDLAQQDRFIRNAAQRLKSLAEEQGQLTQARQKVEEEYSRQKTMLRIIEERLAQMRLADEREAEDKRLNEIIDNSFGRRASAAQARGKARDLEFLS